MDLRAPVAGARALSGAVGCLWWLAVAGTAALAAGLGALLLARRSLSTDEAVGIAVAGQRLGELLHDAVHSEPGQGVYLLLLHPVARVEDAEWAVRALSVAAAVLAVVFVYLLGARLVGRLGGLVAALALATNAGVVTVSQQARPHALSLLAIAGSTLLFVRALDGGSRVGWAAYVVSAPLLALLHPAAASVLPAHGAAALTRNRRDRPSLVALGLASAAVLPVLAAAAVDRAEASGGEVLRLREVGDGLAQAVGWSPVLAAAGIAGVAAIAAGRLPGAMPWKAVLVGGLVVAPLAALLLTAIGLPVRAEHVLVLAAPGLALGAGAAVASLAERWALAMAGALAASAAVTLVFHYVSEPAEDWRAAARGVRLARRPGETVVVVPERARAALAYYAPEVATTLRAGGKSAWVVVPADTPVEAIALGRTVVPTPRYALRRQFRYGSGLRLQHWIRP